MRRQPGREIFMLYWVPLATLQTSQQFTTLKQLRWEKMCDNKNPLRYLSSRLSLKLHLGLETFEQEFGVLIHVHTHFTFSLTSDFLNLNHTVSHSIRWLYLFAWLLKTLLQCNDITHAKLLILVSFSPIPLPSTYLTPLSHPPTHTLPLLNPKGNSESSARIFLFYRVGLFDFLIMILKTF